MKTFGMIMGVIAVVVVLGLIVSFPIMWLWNGCLTPAVDGVNEIGWLQAWGLFILFGLLFKTYGGSNVKK